MDVLELLVQGKPNKEIASALNLGEGTVKIHVAAIFRYFGVHNRAAGWPAAISRPVLRSSTSCFKRLVGISAPEWDVRRPTSNESGNTFARPPRLLAIRPGMTAAR